jgi:glutathione S-transferase
MLAMLLMPASSAALPTPFSWGKLEELLPSASRPRPAHLDSVLDRSTPTFSSWAPTLFRERHGWCPYSERVWLALELKGIAYDTVTIDNTGGGRPSYFAGSTPQMRWADGRTQGESNDLVKALDAAFPDTPPLWPPDGIPSSDVSFMISEWKRTMPSARPSSRAAFLFDYDGDPLPRTTFDKALARADELLGTHAAGPFFCGAVVSAADVAWAPFLERCAAAWGCRRRARCTGARSKKRSILKTMLSPLVPVGLGAELARPELAPREPHAEIQCPQR